MCAGHSAGPPSVAARSLDASLNHPPPAALLAVKNGRLAMIAVLGELMAQQVSGMGTYEQLGAIVDSLPLPF